MIISFFGHADFRESPSIRQRLFSLLRREASGEKIELFLGGYGAFDAFVRRCGQEYKRENSLCSLILVTPYPEPKEGQSVLYDGVVYPPLEETPPRYAIVHRNRYMVKEADMIVVFVERDWGGAYQALLEAQRKKKRIINLAKE